MESVFPWKVRILDTRNTHYQSAGYWLSCSRGRLQRRPLIGQNVTSLAGPGLPLAARDVERIASGCAAGSSTAPPCASLPALDTFRPSRREHQDWSLLPSSPKASERPTRSVPSLERSRTKSSNQEDFTRWEHLKRDSRERDQPGQNLVELDFQLWKPKRTDFRKSETTFPKHYTMFEGKRKLLWNWIETYFAQWLGARAGNDDHARTGVLPPHPSLGGGGLQHLHLQGDALADWVKASPPISFYLFHHYRVKV